MRLKKLALLDRDGVVNVDFGYVYQPERFVFTPHFFEFCSVLVKHGYQIAIVTNQSGIGRGFFSQQDFDRLTAWMENEFHTRGFSLVGVFCCPHSPSEHCSCRKPSPKMFFEAMNLAGVAPENCINVGDKDSDMLAGINAGIIRNFQFLPNLRDNSSNQKLIKTVNDLLDIEPFLDD